jgi:hypothetical protein
VLPNQFIAPYIAIGLAKEDGRIWLNSRLNSHGRRFQAVRRIEAEHMASGLL